MDNLFLSREVGSIETGPQTFAGTNVLGTTFNFNPYPPIIEGPGLFNSVRVQNGGASNLMGIFTYTADFEGKAYYNKDGNPDLFIVYFNARWGIYDFSINSIDPIYFAIQDVLYPWNATTWQSINSIYNPVPLVQKVL